MVRTPNLPIRKISADWRRLAVKKSDCPVADDVRRPSEFCRSPIPRMKPNLPVMLGPDRGEQLTNGLEEVGDRGVVSLKFAFQFREFTCEFAMGG
jgi:hypothetical protein